MLTFACAEAPDRRFPSLAEAEAACPGGVLVLDAEHAPPAAPLPPEAVLNRDAEGVLLPPRPVAAAGGYVVRSAPGGVELLLIFRRGEWDLPKGKLDAGETEGSRRETEGSRRETEGSRRETPEAGALREVEEETGARGLRLLCPLGTTLHGYPFPRKPAYAVKTTHWFAMALADPAQPFVPQAEEGIERVEWVPWAEAGARLGFESLRRHHAGLDVRAFEGYLGLPGAPSP